MSEKERYATIGTWVEVFRSEGVKICSQTIRVRLKAAGIIGLTARNRMGHVVCSGFYPESDIRRLLAYHLQDMPQAGEDGTFEKDGQIYGCVNALSRLLKIPQSSIRFRNREGTIKSVTAKDVMGRVYDFYSLAEVQKLCTALIAERKKYDD